MEVPRQPPPNDGPILHLGPKELAKSREVASSGTRTRIPSDMDPRTYIAHLYKRLKLPAVIHLLFRDFQFWSDSPAIVRYIWDAADLEQSSRPCLRRRHTQRDVVVAQSSFRVAAACDEAAVLLLPDGMSTASNKGTS